MKRLNLIMIALWCLIGAIIAGIIIAGVFFNMNSGFSFSGVDNLALATEQSFPVSEIHGIDLDLSSDECNVYASDDENITVKHYVQNGKDSDRTVSVTSNGGTLHIKTQPVNMPQIFFFHWGTHRSVVEIYLPASFKDRLDVDIKSGTLRFDTPLDLKSLDIDISSGTLRTDEEITAKTVDVEVKSGTIRLTGGLICNQYSVEASSGTITIDNLQGSGEIDVRSGTIRLSGVEIAESLDVKASSGIIDISLAGNPSLNFAGRKSSGTLRTYFETFTSSGDKRSTATVGDGPYKDLNVSVTSGTIKITQD